MHANRYVLTVFLTAELTVPPDDLLILAVGGYKHGGIYEELTEGGFVIDQHVAGRRAHEELDPAYLRGVYP